MTDFIRRRRPDLEIEGTEAYETNIKCPDCGEYLILGFSVSPKVILPPILKCPKCNVAYLVEEVLKKSKS